MASFVREAADAMRTLREHAEGAGRALDHIEETTGRIAANANNAVIPKGGQTGGPPGLHTGSGAAPFTPHGTYSTGTVLNSAGQPVAGGNTVRIGGSGGGGGFGSSTGMPPSTPGTYMGERRGNWVWQLSQATHQVQWVYSAGVSTTSSGGGPSGAGPVDSRANDPQYAYTGGVTNSGNQDNYGKSLLTVTREQTGVMRELLHEVRNANRSDNGASLRRQGLV